jgi:hypothetical protein
MTVQFIATEVLFNDNILINFISKIN